MGMWNYVPDRDPQSEFLRALRKGKPPRGASQRRSERLGAEGEKCPCGEEKRVQDVDEDAKGGSSDDGDDLWREAERIFLQGSVVCDLGRSLCGLTSRRC